MDRNKITRITKDSWLLNKPIAHRGLYNSKYPENSLGAFENAVKNGYPVELDLQLLSDGEIVIFHDSTLNRVCGVDVKLHSLKKENLNTYKLQDTSYRIPTLTQVLETINGKVPILFEFKTELFKHHEFEISVNNILQYYKGEYAIESFNPFVLKWYKKNRPDVLRGQLSSFFGDKFNPVKQGPIKKLSFNRITKPDFISYEKDYLPNKFVDKYKNKCAIIAYTIKSEEDKNIILPHCDNYIFDNFLPDLQKD